MTLACPDCGSPLNIRSLANSTHVCQCTNNGCRADWVTQGKTAGAAADKFVQKCERYGYTVALCAKIAALAQEFGS